MGQIHLTENELKKIILEETLKVASKNGVSKDELLEGWRGERQGGSVYSSDIEKLTGRELYNFAVNYHKTRKILRNIAGGDDLDSFQDAWNNEETKQQLINALTPIYQEKQNEIKKKHGENYLYQSGGEEISELKKTIRNLSGSCEYYKWMMEEYENGIKDIASLFNIDEDTVQVPNMSSIIKERITELQQNNVQLTKTVSRYKKTNAQLTAQVKQLQGQIGQSNAEKYNDQVYAAEKARALSNPSGPGYPETN